MSYRKTNDYKRRLDNLFAKTAAIDDMELQAEWSKYLCVLTSGFLEVTVKEILSEYAKNKSHDNVANFIENDLDDFRNPNMEKIIKLTRKFNTEWGERLKADTEGEISDAINSIVNDRNQIAHGKSVGVTFNTMKGWYRESYKIVELLTQMCA